MAVTQTILSIRQSLKTHGLFDGPQFHALHYVHPDSYMSSVVKIFDWVCRDGLLPAKQDYCYKGVSGAFGSAIERRLRDKGLRIIYESKFDTH